MGIVAVRLAMDVTFGILRPRLMAGSPLALRRLVHVPLSVCFGLAPWVGLGVGFELPPSVRRTMPGVVPRPWNSKQTLVSLSKICMKLAIESESARHFGLSHFSTCVANREPRLHAMQSAQVQGFLPSTSGLQ